MAGVANFNKKYTTQYMLKTALQELSVMELYMVVVSI